MCTVYIIFSVLLVQALVNVFIIDKRALYVSNYATGALVYGGAAIIAYGAAYGAILSDAFFLVDALSALLVLVIGILCLFGVVVSIEYLKRENITARKRGQYLCLFQLFVLSMLLVVTFNSAGLAWVAIEATTVISALLVVFHASRQSLEAGWKYVVLCTIGICFALLGIILIYYADIGAGGSEADALNWYALIKHAPHFEPKLAVLAFVFIIIGYGTKAGLAPMHTWLPDAHSQAPAPVSALLSGGLIATAFYAIVRNVAVFKQILQPALWQGILTAFALLSIAIVIPFLYKQNDLKRLLAYSSIENMGILVLALTGNCYLAAYGLVMHIFNHALNKSALFYLSGEIIAAYKTKHISRLKAMIAQLPLLGWLLFAAVLSITGLPPSAVFWSKLYIIFGLVSAGKYFAAIFALTAIACVFMLLLKSVMRVCFGEAAAESAPTGRPSAVTLVCSGIMLAALVVTGVYQPDALRALFERAAQVIANH